MRSIYRHETLGWIGMVLILGAYGLLSFHIIPVGPFYHSINLLGSLGILTTSYFKKDHPSMTLNIIWSLIAIVVLVSVIIR